MDTTQMTPKEFLALMDEHDDEPDGVTCVKEGDWTQDHKYQCRAQTYKVEATGQYFTVFESRSGSYHTDWYYNDPECVEVEPVTVTKTVTVTTYVQKKKAPAHTRD